MAKFHKIIGLLFISQIHNNNALNLSTDLNTLSLKEIDHYLDEAAEILDIYPRGMGKMNEEVGPLPMSKNNRLSFMGVDQVTYLGVIDTRMWIVSRKTPFLTEILQHLLNRRLRRPRQQKAQQMPPYLRRLRAIY